MSLCRYLPVPSDRMGIIWSLLSVKDSIILEYGPAGTTHFSMGFYGTLGVDWQQRLFTTHMNEDDVVMGDVTRLEEAIVELDKSYEPKVIFVVASSISAVIGTDIKGVCNYMQKEVQAKLVAFEQGGFRGDYSIGLTEVYKLLVNNLPCKEQKKKKKMFNIIGASMGSYRAASDVWELQNLMREAFGYEMHTCLCHETSVDEIADIGTAEINLVMRQEGLAAAEVLKNKFDMPFVFSAPYGYAATLAWLEDVGKILGQVPDVKMCARLRLKAQNTASLKMYAMMMGRKKTPQAAVTDGYNTYEEEFHRTRRLLEELRGSDAEIMICTKSDLVLRDLDLLKSFPKVTVSWSVNTLDEQFCADMDNAVSIERRLKAMRQTYEAGIRTVCFVSPIFPRITDVKAIIEEVKDYADLIWLENLNLRGQFKGGIMTYIREKYPDLIPLYEEIYNKKRLEYWQALEQDISNYAKEQGFPYRINDLPYGRSEKGKPVIVNYFYHEKIRLTK